MHRLTARDIECKLWVVCSLDGTSITNNVTEIITSLKTMDKFARHPTRADKCPFQYEDGKRQNHQSRNNVYVLKVIDGSEIKHRLQNEFLDILKLFLM
mmetsp:Transcript_39198/g.117866  ORF Transcript_39198/g.117866 Transcript_39198/m.117866 type:complete len:98 (-) Transcript_39198:953-1246(-)